MGAANDLGHLRIRLPLSGHLSTKATFLADSPYIDSCLNLSTMATFLADSPYIDSCLNLSTMATFSADSPYIDSCLNLSTMAASLQWPLSSLPKVAVVVEVQLYLK